jgi:hypothetical protein
MKSSILAASDLNLGLAKMLAADIPADQWTTQFGKMINHPAWQYGHMAVAAQGAVKSLGGDAWLDDSWGELFGIGSTPVADASKYPGNDELLAALVESHTRAKPLFEQADDALLAKELEAERARKRFGTVGNLVVFLLTGHEMFHLGQLSHWRRAAGLGSVL